MLVDLNHLQKSSTANVERLAKALGIDTYDRDTWLREGRVVWHHVIAVRVAGVILVESLRARIAQRARR